MAAIEKTSLMQALERLLEAPVHDVDYTVELLQGGTVGDVSKIIGTAVSGTERHPFSLVMKEQRTWDRHGDPGCWRREYEIYKNGLDRALLPSVKLPQCYLLEEEPNTTRIWMEYIEGATGNEQLHAAELALAAERLGEQQAHFHRSGPRGLPYLRGFPAVRSSFDLWWGRMRKPLSGEISGFPEDVRGALNDYASRADALLASFGQLPQTLCQGDVHHDNLFLRESPEGTDIYLIDWDSAGYGAMGEDAIDVLMEAFVYSSRDVSLLPEFRKKILNGYRCGARRQGVDLPLNENLARDIFALAWGFRIADLYLYYQEEAKKQRCVDILRAMLREEA